ncbi:MAG: hypothetical protein ACM3ML_11300 [Micromonosporaceae bacterium]
MRRLRHAAFLDEIHRDPFTRGPRRLRRVTSAVYPDKAADIKCYWHVMNKLVTEATQPQSTAAALHRILEET